MAAVSFSTIAPSYDFLARLVYGKSIIKAQTCFLNHIPEDASVLIIGGGTGWILEEVLRHKRVSHIDYIEASATMVRLAQKKYRTMEDVHRPPVHFTCGTEHAIPPGARYDAILTFFVLDVQPDNTALHAMMSTLYRHLKKSGLWFFADFKPKEQWWHQALVKLMFWFFRLVCNLSHNRLPDYDRAFKHLKLKKKLSKSFYGQLIHSEVYEVK